jgi:Peptidase family S41
MSLEDSHRACGCAHAALLLAILTLPWASAASAQVPAPFDRQGWLQDLGEARAAFSTKYAGLEWEVFERDVDLNAVFATAEDRIAHAENECDARKAFERLMSRFGDKHVLVRWPSTSPAPPHSSNALACEAMGYTTRMQAAPLAALLPGFTPLLLPPGNVFPTGVMARGSRQVGIIKVPLFMARGFPSLCEQAVEELHIDRTRQCDDDCQDRVSARAENILTLQFEAAIEAVKASGAIALLVDIAGNGGGSEWEGAASRMVTAVRLEALRNYFVKEPLWERHFAQQKHDLEDARRKVREGGDRALLTRFIDKLDEREREARQPCDASALWEGKHPSCTWLGDAFFSTGLLSSANPDALRAKPWASLVFTPLQYPYHEGVWRGPLIVVVDGGSASAAEHFAAELQDNHAAVIVGSPTAGAGCGHTDGGTPTRLSHSGGSLELSDCVRIRRDGQNLASGIQPDILVGFREDDPPKRRVSLLDEKLGLALDAAGALVR